jgi:hypothetical protein
VKFLWNSNQILCKFFNAHLNSGPRLLLVSLNVVPDLTSDSFCEDPEYPLASLPPSLASHEVCGVVCCGVVDPPDLTFWFTSCPRTVCDVVVVDPRGVIRGLKWTSCGSCNRLLPRDSSSGFFNKLLSDGILSPRGLVPFFLYQLGTGTFFFVSTCINCRKRGKRWKK